MSMWFSQPCICVYVIECMYVCMRIYERLFACVCIIWVFVYVFCVCMCIYVRVCVCVYLCVYIVYKWCMYVYSSCVWVFMYVYLYICMCICVYISVNAFKTLNTFLCIVTLISSNMSFFHSFCFWNRKEIYKQLNICLFLFINF